jgi:hypothetical protein
MSSDLAVEAERLRDDLEEFRRTLHKKYRSKTAQVTSPSLTRQAASLAERGLVDLTGPTSFSGAVGDKVSADLALGFQRLLTASEKAARRKTYDAALLQILPQFTARIVVPLKQVGIYTNPQTGAPTMRRGAQNLPPSAFLGHSFDAADSHVVQCVRDTLELLGIEVVTGERPKADSISSKVKKLIDDQPMFVGLYTRRDKVARKNDWTTSAWVIEEKAYAIALRKKLLLLKEDGISSIGGMQGDYEYLNFDRDELHRLVLKLFRLFEIEVRGFAD